MLPQKRNLALQDTVGSHVSRPPRKDFKSDLVPYKYSPLPTPTSIRLLELDGFDERGRLKFSLQTFDLEAGIPYDALSYTWGDPFVGLGRNAPSPEFSQDIEAVCNGSSLPISQNLADALHQLQRPRDVNKRWKKFGWTTLHFRAHRGQLRAVKMLIRKGVDLNPQDLYGRTPILYAIGHREIEVVRTLVEAGADLNIADNNGLTPLKYAQNCGAKVEEEYLLSILEGPKSDRAETRVESRPYYLWADAICINQEDHDECSAQVKIMRTVYSRADTVISWLGRAKENAHQAVEFIENLSALGNNGFENAIYQHEISGKLSESTRNYLEEIPTIQYREFRRLVDRTYFTRSWVIQEIALSSENIMLVGPHEIQVESLRDIVVLSNGLLTKDRYSRISKLINYREFPTGESINLDRTNLFLGIFEYHNLVKAGGHRYFAELLNTNLLYRATDPRDKVYSILGLLHPMPDVLPIEPDYRKSGAEVYTEATRFVLNHHQDLWVLSLVRDKAMRSFDGVVPSWVADFNMIGDVITIYNPGSRSATPDSTSRLLPTSDPWILGIQGYRTDRIVELSSVHSPKEDVRVRYHRSWITISSKLPKAYPGTSYARGEALYRTLVTDLLEETPWDELDMDKVLPSAREAFSFGVCLEAHLMAMPLDQTPSRVGEFLEGFLDEIDAFAAEDGAGGIPRADEIRQYKARQCSCDEADEKVREERGCRFKHEMFHELNDAEFFDYGGAERYLDYIFRVYIGRRLFRTENGYLGLAPNSVDVGDEIWLLPGGRTPYIMRPVVEEKEGAAGKSGGNDNGTKESRRDRYEHMGECFVLGYMNGEMYKPDEMELRDIEII